MKKNEISSTEKLLEQIRENRSGTSASDTLMPPPDKPATPATGLPSRLRAALQFTHSARIGVDIGYTDVRLIKTIPSGANRHQIIAYRRVPFDPGMDPQNLLFPQFLRNTLADFPGATEGVSIWTTTSSARLDTRLLRIPKVPRRQVPNAVIWAYKRKSPYDEKKHLFDFEVVKFATQVAIRREVVGAEEGVGTFAQRLGHRVYFPVQHLLVGLTTGARDDTTVIQLN